MDILKEKLCIIRGPEAQLVDLIPGNALGIQWNNDEGFILVGWAITGVGKQAHPVRLHAISGPHLSAVDHQVISTYNNPN